MSATCTVTAKMKAMSKMNPLMTAARARKSPEEMEHEARRPTNSANSLRKLPANEQEALKSYFDHEPEDDAGEISARLRAESRVRGP